MSDKISGFTVVFKESVSEEYMDMVKQSVSLIKGVGTIEPIVEGIDTFLGASQEGSRIKRFLIDMIKSDFKTGK